MPLSLVEWWPSGGLDCLLLVVGLSAAVRWQWLLFGRVLLVLCVNVLGFGRCGGV